MEQTMHAAPLRRALPGRACTKAPDRRMQMQASSGPELPTDHAFPSTMHSSPSTDSALVTQQADPAPRMAARRMCSMRARYALDTTLKRQGLPT